MLRVDSLRVKMKFASVALQVLLGRAEPPARWRIASLPQLAQVLGRPLRVTAEWYSRCYSRRDAMLPNGRSAVTSLVSAA
jgi:hypothetical protein